MVTMAKRKETGNIQPTGDMPSTTLPRDGRDRRQMKSCNDQRQQPDTTHVQSLALRDESSRTLGCLSKGWDIKGPWAETKPGNQQVYTSGSFLLIEKPPLRLAA